jgi:hypothetical protein
MKKYLLLLPALALLAAGCGQSTTQSTYKPTTAQNQDSNTTSNNTTQPLSPDANSVPEAPSTPVVGKVQITISPTSGPVGTKVTITGQGFTPTGNLLIFGDPGTRFHPDHSAENIIGNLNSANGTTLTFTVPTSNPSGSLCDSNNNCVMIAATRRLPGDYNVSITNSNGTSNITPFTIK